MKRAALALTCFVLASPLLALKPRHFPPNAPAGAPNVHTISGSPLTIDIGDDTSMQVYNTNVPGTGQFYPPDCSPGQTADSGIFLSIGTTVYGPDFNNHPCGSASNSYTPWTPISFAPVTGTGASNDPFTQVIVVQAGLAFQVTETLTYVNGAYKADIVLSITNVVGSAPEGGAAFKAFIGADLFLADNDSGFPFATPPTASGSHGASSDCSTQLQYTISMLGTTPATHFSANGYSQIWGEISGAALSDTIAPGCLDDGAALEWDEVFAGTPITVDTGVSFTGQAVPVGAVVPTLSWKGLTALIVLLGVVGYVLARRMSLGA
jgi:hypothetical protein